MIKGVFFVVLLVLAFLAFTIVRFWPVFLAAIVFSAFVHAVGGRRGP